MNKESQKGVRRCATPPRADMPRIRGPGTRGSSGRSLRRARGDSARRPPALGDEVAALLRSRAHSIGSEVFHFHKEREWFVSESATSGL